jgi:hypothetical protein
MSVWVEANIHHTSTDDRPLILALYHGVVKQTAGLVSWHYFREPEIRFRLEVSDDAEAARVAELIRQLVDTRRSDFRLEKLVFGRHGREGEKYEGEHEVLGKEGFEVHKMIWMWQSELAVLRYRQEASGSVEKDREYDVDRLWHLVANQLGPLAVHECNVDFGGLVLRESILLKPKRK